MNARRVFCLCILVITPRYHSTYRCNAAERNNYFNSRIFDTSICNAQQKYITRQFDNQLDTNWWIWRLHLSYSRKSFDLRNIFTNLVFDLTSFMLHYFFTSLILVLETLPRFIICIVSSSRTRWSTRLAYSNYVLITINVGKRKRGKERKNCERLRVFTSEV